MMSGLVRVAFPKRQGAKFKNKEGLVLDCTRSLAKGEPLVYFVQFDSLGIRAWFEEDQLVACPAVEDDTAA